MSGRYTSRTSSRSTGSPRLRSPSSSAAESGSGALSPSFAHAPRSRSTYGEWDMRRNVDGAGAEYAARVADLTRCGTLCGVIEVSREQVLAHRQAVHGLVERRPRLDALAVLDLGVQNTPPGALQAALSARLADPLPPSADLTADGALTLAWTLRGAPHLHRTADLPVLAAAGWPRDDADAAARLGWQRKRLAEVDGAARWAFRAVAEAVRVGADPADDEG